MSRRRPIFLVATVLAALVLGGCNSDPESTSDQGASTSETTATTEATTTTDATTTTEPGGGTTTPSPPPFTGATTPTSAPPPAGATEVALLQDVEVSGGAGVDRVVFRFTDAQLPGYQVAYLDGPARQGGSGDVVAVEGGAVLEVRLEPASGVDLRGGTFEQTYRGPERVRGDTAHVTEAVLTGDFEANLTWAVGVDATVPYRVEVLPGENAIVVELAR